MINEETIDHFNTRLTADLNNIKRMTANQLDQVKAYGSRAEALLKNRDLAMMIHHYKFDVLDAITAIPAHDADSNSRRVALSNQLAGIDQFVASLQRAVYIRNRVVTQQEEGPRAEPADITKREYSV